MNENLEYDTIETRKVNGNNDNLSNSFYSSNSSIILFVYWYKGISEINVSVMISQTKCKPVTINPCILSDCGSKFGITCNQTYHDNLLTYGGIHISHLIDDVFEYVLYGLNCVIILLSNTHFYIRKMTSCNIKCDITLTPGQPVDIQLKLARYYSDFNIIEKALTVSKNNNISFGNLSEPAVPRISLFIKFKNQAPLSGIYFLQDASFEFQIHTLLIRSRIELFIQTRPAIVTSHLNLRRMAVDFLPSFSRFFDHRGGFLFPYAQYTLYLNQKPILQIHTR